MSWTDLLLIMLVAIICGVFAQLTSRYTHGGWIVNMGLGFMGALTGVAVSRWLNAPLIYNLKTEGVDFPIMYSIIGSVFFLAAIGFFIKPSRR